MAGEEDNRSCGNWLARLAIALALAATGLGVLFWAWAVTFNYVDMWTAGVDPPLYSAESMTFTERVAVSVPIPAVVVVAVSGLSAIYFFVRAALAPWPKSPTPPTRF